MKKILYILILSIAFSSCKKDHPKPSKQPIPDGKLYPVSFNIHTLSATIGGFSLKNPAVNSLKTNTAPALSDQIDILYYAVYDSGGNVVHQITQKSTAAGFGSITDDLALGTYTVVMAGGKKGLSFENKNLATGYFWYYQNQDDIHGNPATYLGFDDTFFSKFNITISTANNTNNVTLSRIVSQLQVHIEDALPATAYSMIVTLSNDFTHFNIADTTRTDTVANDRILKIPTANQGLADYTFSIIMLNTTQPFNVRLRCTGYSGILADKTISNVSCYVNKVTLLTGKLFGGSTGNSTGGFQLTFNSDWDPVTLNYGF